jgi:hypothetical protein
MNFKLRFPQSAISKWAAGYADASDAAIKDAGVSMRTLDKALWQYSKVNQ